MKLLPKTDDLLEIAELPAADSNEEEVVFHGQIHRIREMNDFAFVIVRTHNELVQTIFIPAEADFLLSELKENDVVVVQGRTRHDERSRCGYDIVLKHVDHLAGAVIDAPVTINKKKLNISLDVKLQHRAFSLRNQSERAVFKIQEGVCRTFRDYMFQQKFTEIHTPKLVRAGAEGGSNIFNLEYFGQTAYLAQSPQLYKQIMVGVFERVFEIGPVFRAEKHDTSRHLNEYTSLDFEMGFIRSYEDIISMEIGFLRYMMQVIREEYVQECEELALVFPNTESIVQLKFIEAKELFSSKMNRKITDLYDFEPAEEQALCNYMKKHHDADFVFVTHYPSAKRPFYAMDDPSDPGFTLSFDLLFRGLEITTGGQRIHLYQDQVDKMLARAMAIEPFESYLLAHKMGLPPHGGLGIGLERVTAKLVGFDNIKNATLYPRDINRLDP